MIAPILLAIFAVVINSVGSRWLRGAAWTRQAPGLGIVAWQTLTASFILSLVLAGLTLAMPKLPGNASFAALVRACVSGIRAQYETPAGTALSVAGGLVAVALLVRVAWCVSDTLFGMRRHRDSQRQHLMMASQMHPIWDVRVVDHAWPAAYCIPGPDRTVVFTAGAFQVLDDQQVRAVIAHELAHLNGRHDFVVAFAGALRRALPFVISMRIACDELAQLVEMRADDVALRSNDRLSIAKALVHLAEGPVPVGALGASGAAFARLDRLAEPPHPLGPATRLIGVSAVFCLLLAPIVLSAIPALMAAAEHYCPFLPIS